MVRRRSEPGYAWTLAGPIALQIQAALVVRTTAEAVVVRKSILKREIAQKTLQLSTLASARRLAALFGARLVDAQSTATDFFAVELSDGCLALTLIGHLDETETSRTIRLTIHEHFYRRNLAEFGKGVAQF